LRNLFAVNADNTANNLPKYISDCCDPLSVAADMRNLLNSNNINPILNQSLLSLSPPDFWRSILENPVYSS
jgi:hypothetical protein